MSSRFSYRIFSRRFWWTAAIVRSTTYRTFPQPAPVRLARAARTRGSIPIHRRRASCPSESYARSAYNSPGRLPVVPVPRQRAGHHGGQQHGSRRGCSRRSRWHASGIPVRSTIRWCFAPFFPRSVGFGPVSTPQKRPARWTRRWRTWTSPASRPCATAPAATAWILSQVPSACQSAEPPPARIPHPQPISAGRSSHGSPVLRTKGAQIQSIYKDNRGDLWLGTNDSGAYRFNGKAFEKFRP